MKNFTNKFQIIIPPQDIACEPGLQEKLASGDREGFAWVYKNYCKIIYDYALLITGNNEQSEDAVQDVFIKVWMNREKIREHENFNGYVRLLCRNYLLNVLQSEKNEKKRRRNYFEMNEQTSNSVEEIINGKEETALMKKAVNELPEKQGEVLALKGMGLKRVEIARVMQTSELAVRGHLYRGVRFVRGKVREKL